MWRLKPACGTKNHQKMQTTTGSFLTRPENVKQNGSHLVSQSFLSTSPTIFSANPNGEDQYNKDDFLFGPGSIWTFSVVTDKNDKNGCQIRISRDSKQNTMNIFWLIPQYIVITVAEVRSNNLIHLLTTISRSWTLWPVSSSLTPSRPSQWNQSFNHSGCLQLALEIFSMFSLSKFLCTQLRYSITGLFLPL